MACVQDNLIREIQIIQFGSAEELTCGLCA